MPEIQGKITFFHRNLCYYAIHKGGTIKTGGFLNNFRSVPN